MIALDGKESAELRQAVAELFHLQPIPADSQIIECGCEDCSQLFQAFAGRTWDTVPAETVDTFYSKLPLFHPVAHRYYFPAYMRRGLSEVGAASGAPVRLVRDFVIYALCPDYNLFGDILFTRYFGLFSESQMRLVAAWLRFILQHAEELDADAEVAQRGYDAFWHLRLEA
jgi:hypothetical protein